MSDIILEINNEILAKSSLLDPRPIGIVRLVEQIVSEDLGSAIRRRESRMEGML